MHVQKRLVLCNLKELYRLLNDKFPNVAKGFSKFADLRPKHCDLAGASETYSVHVCTIHQNVKLMMVGVKLPDLASHAQHLSSLHCTRLFATLHYLNII